MKTRKPSKKNASVEALGVRYAELLRLRGDVQLLEGLRHMDKPKDPRARVAIILRPKIEMRVAKQQFQN